MSAQIVVENGVAVGVLAHGAGAPPPPPSPFSIGGIRGENPRSELVNAFIRRRLAEKETVRVSVYPSGVEIHTGKEPSNPPPVGVQRGRIQGFTDEAKRRLKRAFLTLHVSDYCLRGITLTTHRKLSGDEYRAALGRFKKRVAYADWAAIVRHEVQRRGAPHSHLALWTPRGVTPEQIRDAWLECTGEAGDRDARKFAVLVKELSQDESGWVVYMAKHDAKEDEVQSAWNGKHWSVWNQRILKERTPDDFTLTAYQHALLLRVLRNHQRALRRRDVERLRRKYLTACFPPSESVVEVAQLIPQAGGTYVALDDAGFVMGWTTDAAAFILAGAEKAAWLKLKRNKVRELHKGDLLRLLPGEVVKRLVRGILDGTLYGQRDGDPF